MSTYRERRLAKAERLREWADKRETKADAAHTTAERLAGMIPLGQPILVGHHSEGKHRRHIDRIQTGYERAHEHATKAQDMRRRADGIEHAADRAIYSDDPDAPERLAERLADLETQRAGITAYNKTCRAGAPDPDLLRPEQRRELDALDARPDLRAHVLKPDGSFRPYAAQNIGGNITRTRQRLASLDRRPAAEQHPQPLNAPCVTTESRRPAATHREYRTRGGSPVIGCPDGCWPCELEAVRAVRQINSESADRDAHWRRAEVAR